MKSQHNMQYFNRHEVMTMEVLNQVGEIRRAVDDFRFENPHLGLRSLGISNFLCGLYDGFDYTDQILKSTDYAVIKEFNPKLAKRIKSLLNVIATYPKSDKDVTVI